MASVPEDDRITGGTLMKLYGHEFGRQDLLRRVGGLHQVAGVRVLTFDEGHGRGTRFVEFRTGTGFRFSVLVDRGFDVGPAEYAGMALQWESAKGYAAPTFYEDVSEYSWLRYGLGGLCNTGGLLAIGDRQTVPLDFNFGARASDFYGIHGHVAVTPASRFSVGERWEGEQCVLWAEGEIREEIAYGEHLVLRRRYEAEVGGNSFRMTDEVTNEGFHITPHQMLYHFNIGYPVVDDGAELLHGLTGDVTDYSYAAGEVGSFADVYPTCTPPQPRWGHTAGYLPLVTDEHGWSHVALVNRRLGGRGGTGVVLRYDASVLPAYTHNHMMGEGLYTVGMEPSTNPTGTIPDLLDQGYNVHLAPGESRTYRLEFGVLADGDAIDHFSPHG
jgi:hypothetical protein